MSSAIWFFLGSLWTLILLRVFALRLPKLPRAPWKKSPHVNFTVTAGYAPQKIAAIKLLRETFGWGLRESKDAIEGHAFTVNRGPEANVLQRDLERLGMLVKVT